MESWSHHTTLNNHDEKSLINIAMQSFHCRPWLRFDPIRRWAFLFTIGRCLRAMMTLIRRTTNISRLIARIYVKLYFSLSSVAYVYDVHIQMREVLIRKGWSYQQFCLCSCLLQYTILSKKKSVIANNLIRQYDHHCVVIDLNKGVLKMHRQYPIAFQFISWQFFSFQMSINFDFHIVLSVSEEKNENLHERENGRRPWPRLLNIMHIRHQLLSSMHNEWRKERILRWFYSSQISIFIRIKYDHDWLRFISLMSCFNSLVTF